MKRALLLFILFLLMPHCANAAAAQKPDSLSVKIGQMLMIGFRGLDAHDEPSLEADIRLRGIGGVVLFDYDVLLASPVRNIESPGQLSHLTAELQKMTGIPLFIAIDQEGGRIRRLKPSRGFPESVSAAHLGAINSLDSTRSAATGTASLLRQLGINMNFAPDVDLNSNPDNPVIGKLERSFSAAPEIVTRHAGLFVKSFQAQGIIPVLKHFPGHGSSTKDSHKDFTDVTSTWSERELQPYRKLVREGYHDPVMTAHVFHAGLDSLNPATLSRAIVTDLLREKLGFRGVVISDDLQMKAISERYGLETALRLAIDAGVDILLFANNSGYDPAIAEKASAIIRSLIEKGVISKERIDASYRRIMQLKERVLYPVK